MDAKPRGAASVGSHTERVGRLERLVLPNGIRLVLDPLPGRRSVAVGLFVAGGAGLDPAGQSGLAHYLEHAVFRGAAGRPGRDMNREVDERGGLANGYTDKESTSFVCEVLSEEVAFALDLVADLATAPDFPAPLCLKERDVVLAEAEEADDDGEERVHDLLEAALWPKSALARPVVGLAEEVARLGVEDLVRHHGQTYRPERMVLAVSGGFDPAQVAAHVRRRLGAFAPAGTAAIAPPLAPGLPARVAHRAALSQVHLCLAVPGLARRDPRLLAAQVLVEGLGGGAASRLFEHLREEQGLAYTVYAELEAYADRGFVGAYAAVAPDALDQAARGLADELSRVGREGLSAEEVSRAQAAIRGGWIMAAESVSSRMQRLGDEELFGGGARSVEDRLDALMAIDAAAVREVARTLLPVPAEGTRWVALGPVAPGWRPRAHLRAV